MVLPCQEDLGSRSGFHGKLRAHRDGVPEPDGTFGGGDADAPVALAAEDLGAFAGGIAQLHEYRAGGGDQAVFACSGCELNEPAAEDKPSLDIPAYEPVMDKGKSEPMHRWPGQASSRYELRQGGGSGLQCVKHMGRFIDDTDSARIVHVLILPSHYLRCKSLDWLITEVC